MSQKFPKENKIIQLLLNDKRHQKKKEEKRWLFIRIFTWYFEKLKRWNEIRPLAALGCKEKEHT